MPQSATCTYWAYESDSFYNYEITLSNTSDDPFDIYGFAFGGPEGAPVTQPYPFKDVVIISSPPGWLGLNGYNGVSFGPSASPEYGYIPPGQSGAFIFQSSTPPADQTVFGCCYYNNDNGWGFCTNDVAIRQQLTHKTPNYVHINPLVLLLGDQLFARLNLPRPFDGASLRSQLTAGIRSMTSVQREIASRALETYITALTDIRLALKPKDHL